MTIKLKFLVLISSFFCQYQLMAKDYFVHPIAGRDTNTGLSKEQALQTLTQASKINFQQGDRLLLASGQTYNNSLQLINKQGTAESPILITTILWESNKIIVPAIIDFKGYESGILIQDCSFIEISNIQITANGHYVDSEKDSKMHCGILLTNKQSQKMSHIIIKNVTLYDIFYENLGFVRGEKEVKTANGTQKYGWGIRIINNSTGIIDDVKVQDCHINSVSHTGIKLTGNNKNISNVEISNNNVERTGGPGIQMSGVIKVAVFNNIVTHSGSNDDSRKWGRGSGLWTWGSSEVLIEKNKFMYANGPGDSAGAHIDFNCDNIVLQYNISAFNAGGFCEILGNNYNCSYRYNISINDGFRIKGVDGAFQEGKVFWLSGFQGEAKKRKGPVNTYFYNNTIYTNTSMVAKIAIDKTSSGILIANNIFYLEGGSKVVLGDQYKADKNSLDIVKNVFFKNNLFLNAACWPKEIGIEDSAPIIGDPAFTNKGGMEAKDYIPKNVNLVKHKGITINLLPDDTVGLLQSLKLEKDILGNSINKKPSIGAIEPSK